VSARIAETGTVYQLDRKAEPDEVVTEEDVKDAGKLSRLLMRLLRDVATLTRRFAPKRTDFEDRAVVSGTPLRLPHNFDARVRWWVVDWRPTTPGDVPVFEKSSSTDTRTLVLDVGNSGRVSVRVEVAG
jgi:hypothetical protein